MLNYLSGELYKLCKHKSLYLGVGCLLVLECIVFLPNLWVEEYVAFKQEFLLAFFDIALFVGVFVAPVFAALVFDDQNRNGTLKNEIVYGIPRGRIYFGKLLAGGIAGTLAAVLVAGVYLGYALLLSTPFHDENTWLLLATALVSFIGHWLTWLSVYSFTFFLLMLTRSAVTAVSLVYVITLITFPFSLAAISAEDLPFWLQTVLRLFYTAPLGYLMEGELILGVSVMGEPVLINTVGGLAGWVFGAVLPYSLGVCLLWTVGLSLVGLALFSRREVK